MPSAYCGECGWQCRVDADETVELGRAMIDHFVETGHSPVERRDVDGIGGSPTTESDVPPKAGSDPDRHPE